VQGSTLRPSLNSLLARDGLHKNAEEVTGIAALLENSGLDFLAVLAGSGKEHAPQPVVEKVPPIFAPLEASKTQAKQIESVALRVIHGKTARRKQCVVKEFGSRSSAAQHEYRSFGPRSPHLVLTGLLLLQKSRGWIHHDAQRRADCATGTDSSSSSSTDISAKRPRGVFSFNHNFALR
jgi:hypothetical protein